MAAKTWEADFRYRAIQESIQVVRSTQAEDFFENSTSLCLPVANRPIVGWTPGRIFIIFLVLGFVFLIAAAIIAGIAEKDPNLANDALWMILAASVGFSGMACFFAPVLFDRWIMQLLTGSRGSELANREGEVLCAELSNSDRSQMKITIDGDDYVLLLADAQDRRLLIEGIAARYLIRAEDVIDLKTFQFINYVGVEIAFRINNNISLSIAIARVSLILELTRQLPFLFFMQKWIKNRLYRVCSETLGWCDPHAT